MHLGYPEPDQKYLGNKLEGIRIIWGKIFHSFQDNEEILRFGLITTSHEMFRLHNSPVC